LNFPTEICPLLLHKVS